ncbi:MAG: hypothetical protein U5L11_09300 [Arhodomonas sp.]|nr:hypothetical protein [Arhodomonas sp.]
MVYYYVFPNGGLRSIMTIPKHPRLAWSQVTLDPALAKLAGVEESCALPIWSEDAGEGVPGDPVEHDTTDLLRGLPVAFGEGPEGQRQGLAAGPCRAVSRPCRGARLRQRRRAASQRGPGFPP